MLYEVITPCRRAGRMIDAGNQQVAPALRPRTRSAWLVAALGLAHVQDGMYAQVGRILVV